MYELRCLGEASLRGPAGDLIHFRSRKHLALLIYLALNADRAHRRERLAGLLWSESESSKARHSLSQALYAVRRLLNGTVHIEGEDLELKPGWARIDALELEQHLETGDASSAVELYRGEFLEGFWVRGARGFEEWAERERARVAALAREALRRSIKCARDRCEWWAVRDQAERLVHLDPFDEGAYAELMRALWMSGDRSGAVTRYKRLEKVLKRELGSSPSRETEELAKRIRDRSVRGGWQSQRLLRENEPPAFRDPPFVGRKRELSILAAEWDRVKTGETRAVTLVGEAGIGKTRLAEEFIKSLELEEVLVLRGRCYEAEQVLPYGPLAEAFRDGLKELDLSEVNPLWLAELARIVPEVAQKYGELPEPPQLEAEGSQRRLYEGVVQVLREACDQQPVLLFVDDLHWADESSLALLHYLLRRVTNGLYLLSGLRPDECPIQAKYSLLERASSTTERSLSVHIQPLGDSERSTLLEFLVKGRLDPNVAAALSGMGDGNPFFVIELASKGVDSVADAQAITSVPDKIRALFHRKLEHIGNGSAVLLEQGAILGARFQYETLAEAASLSSSEVDAYLRELVDARILIYDGETIRFRHDLLRQVTRDQIPLARRKILHLRSARVLIRRNGNPGEIARHLFGASDIRKGYAYAIRGSKVACEVFAHGEAASLLGLAIQHSPNEKSRSDLAWQLGSLYWHMRQYDRARPLLMASVGELRQLSGCGSQTLHDRSTELILFELESGSRTPRESGADLQALSVQVESDRNAPLRARILGMLLWVAIRSGDKDLLRNAIDDIKSLRCAVSDPSVGWLLAKGIGIYECYVGKLDRAERLLREAIALAEATGEQRAVVHSYIGLSVFAVRAVRSDLADEITKVALPLAKRSGDPLRVTQLLANCALCYAHDGNIDLAEQLLQQAEDEHGEPEATEISSALRFNRAYAAFLQEDLDKAEVLWNADLQARDAFGNIPSTAGCLAGLGLIAFRRGKIDRARRLASQALALARRTLECLDERHLLEELLIRLKISSGSADWAANRLQKLLAQSKDNDMALYFTTRRLKRETDLVTGR